MSRTLAAVVVMLTALAGGVPSALAADAPPAKTVGILLQSPAPGDGGVVAGGTYTVAVYVDAADQTLSANTDRQMSMTFPTWATVTSVTRMIPGEADANVSVLRVVRLGSDPSTRPAESASDVGTDVPVSASAGWVAEMTVDPATPVGTVLTTTATSAGIGIGSVSVPVVAADAPLCAPGTSTAVCTAAGTTGSPDVEFAPTRTVAVIALIPPGSPDNPDNPGFPMHPMTWGTSVVHTAGNLPGAPGTEAQLDAYLRAWVVSKGGGRLVPGAHSVSAGPTLKTGRYVVVAELQGANYGATGAGTVYAQSAEILTQRLTAEIAVAGPVKVTVKVAPRPRPIKATPRLAG